MAEENTFMSGVAPPAASNSANPTPAGSLLSPIPRQDINTEIVNQATGGVLRLPDFVGSTNFLDERSGTGPDSDLIRALGTFGISSDTSAALVNPASTLGGIANTLGDNTNIGQPVSTDTGTPTGSISPTDTGFGGSTLTGNAFSGGFSGPAAFGQEAASTTPAGQTIGESTTTSTPSVSGISTDPAAVPAAPAAPTSTGFSVEGLPTGVTAVGAPIAVNAEGIPIDPATVPSGMTVGQVTPSSTMPATGVPSVTGIDPNMPGSTLAEQTSSTIAGVQAALQGAVGTQTNPNAPNTAIGVPAGLLGMETANPASTLGGLTAEEAAAQAAAAVPTEAPAEVGATPPSADAVAVAAAEDPSTGSVSPAGDEGGDAPAD